MVSGKFVCAIVGNVKPTSTAITIPIISPFHGQSSSFGHSGGCKPARRLLRLTGAPKRCGPEVALGLLNTQCGDGVSSRNLSVIGVDFETAGARSSLTRLQTASFMGLYDQRQERDGKTLAGEDRTEAQERAARWKSAGYFPERPPVSDMSAAAFAKGLDATETNRRQRVQKPIINPLKAVPE